MIRLALPIALLLTACSGGDQSAQMAAEPQGAPPAAQATAGPRIAYVYQLGFRLPGDAIARAQAAHVALCDRLGAARCQMLAQTRTSGDADYASGTLKLRVDARIARAFSDRLTKAVADAGGRAVDTAVEAEDVSKAIIDNSARVAQRALLVQRLTEILRDRNGKVAELVEAERGLATAQEELEQARGWLAELQSRVATSTFDVSYNAAGPDNDDFAGAIGETLSESGSMILLSVRALLVAAIFAAPWVLVIGGALWLWRRKRRRRIVSPPQG